MSNVVPQDDETARDDDGDDDCREGAEEPSESRCPPVPSSPPDTFETAPKTFDCCSLHVQTTGTLHDSFACSGFPAPSAFPTRTLAAADRPMGTYGEMKGLASVTAAFLRLKGSFS